MSVWGLICMFGFGLLLALRFIIFLACKVRGE